MAAGTCDQCGVEEYMPYVCKFCKGRYCAAHRLPENHACAGLDPYREKLRAEGRVMAPEPGIVRPTYSTTARTRMGMSALWARLDGKMTYVFVGICVAVFVVQYILFNSGQVDLHNNLFVIKANWQSQPWTVLTSIFAHGSFNHLLFNMLALFFFGTALERLIGTRRFTLLFLGAGAMAGIAQVAITASLFGIDAGAVGASGAIQGIMGTMVVLAPRLTVLIFFVVPAPLWALTLFYVVFDLLGAITPGSQIAHFAHLAGLAVGMAFGYYLRQQGLRVMTQPPPQMRRYF